MDIRSSRRCGNVCKLACMRRCGKPVCRLWERACPFPWAVNGFSIGKAAVFHISMTQNLLSHDQVVCGERHIDTATKSRHARTKSPITPPMMKFSANSAIPSPKEPPPGMSQRHIRWRPKGRPQSISGDTQWSNDQHRTNQKAVQAEIEDSGKGVITLLPRPMSRNTADTGCSSMKLVSSPPCSLP